MLLLCGGCGLQPMYDCKNISPRTISVNSIQKSKLNKHKYASRVDKFEYLLSNAVNNMLGNLSLNSYQNLSIDLSYSYDDICENIKQSNKPNKYANTFTVKYTVSDDTNRRQLFSGTINIIDSFYISNNLYSGYLSSNDSLSIASENITKQLEFELLNWYKSGKKQ